MNKAGAQRAAGEDPRSLPAGVVAALRQGGDATAEARKAYGFG